MNIRDIFQFALEYPLIVIAIVIAVVGLYRHRVRQIEKYQQSMQGVAIELGMIFDPHSENFDYKDLRGIGLIERGSSPYSDNVLKREESGTEILIFEFVYTVGSGDFEKKTEQTVAAVRSRGAQIPQFELHPEGLWQKIKAAAGAQDIDFDSNPQFSGNYVLKAVDEAPVRKLFNLEVLSFFAREKGWSVEGNGKWIVAYRQGRSIAPKDVPGYFNFANRLKSLFFGM